ncbi:MAG: hypothetical protein JO087_17625 [Actinobacteria bacterium]|nr:hypothetical protein [Actinomycetota bacterium]
MTVRGRLHGALLATAVLVAACGGGGVKPIALDGSPRFPDAEGVVTSVTVKKITLDGGRTYDVSRKLQSFSTYTMETVPLLQRKGQYVQIGLHGHTMVWIGTIGAPVPQKPPVVFYLGRLVRIDGSRLVFRDGTVLRLGPSVTSPTKSGLVRVEIDPSQHAVRQVSIP